MAARIQNPVRVVWLVCTIALLVATHWPRLVLPGGPIMRMDLVIHFFVFSVWTLLFYHSGLIAAKQCPIRRVVWTAMIAIGFACFDELTQPMFSRSADVTDLGADIGGVIVVCVAIVVVRSMMPTHQNARSEES